VSSARATSEAKESVVTEEAAVVEGGVEPAPPHDPVIQIVKGNPTDDELAALVTVLAGAQSGVSSADLEPQGRDLWGHPADKLRYSKFSWQGVTLVERTHLRR
jgi:hypothetical protein